MRAEIDKSLTNIAEEAGIHHERTILEVDPHEAIVEYSANSGADLVVMGASGQSGLKEHFLESTTDRVSQSIDRSIQIVRS